MLRGGAGRLGEGVGEDRANSWYVRNTSNFKDPNQLADWFEETPDCNYGLWLGDQWEL